ncbi:MAG TPA: hypothetical protein VHX62_11855 [Solirubrobacteraceae bacterium]|nr:hypothetical protein [Solirubrobacteraceae bacterium]
MTHPHHDNHPARQHLQAAIDQAGRLSQPGVKPAYTTDWSAKAAHVGDMSVLLLALRS